MTQREIDFKELEELKQQFVFLDEKLEKQRIISEEIIGEHLLIVNTTPLGMYPNIDSAPALPYSAISPKHTLFDCVYNPRQTRFLQFGAERGACTIDGMRMFIAQAEASWRIWSE